MIGKRTIDGRRSLAAPAAVVLIVIGAMIIFGLGVLGLARTPPAPTTQAAAPSPAPLRDETHPLTDRGLPRSAPVRLVIPAIGVNHPLQRLGLRADHRTMQPPPADRAGWFTSGATPGEIGPTIVVGYIASQRGPGVFAHLGALKVGAQVQLRRADGRVVSYAVDSIASYPAKKFPTAKVYARTARPTLRLITCGGTLKPGTPPGNVVVYGHQVSVRG